MSTDTLLYTSSAGVKYIRTDFENKSKVAVRSPKNSHIKTYRFNKVKEYNHPMLSWANLDCSGTWAHDDKYMQTAVQNNTKPATILSRYANTVAKLDSWENEIDFKECPHKSETSRWNNDRYLRKIYIVNDKAKCLNDIFFIEEIIQHYIKLEFDFNESIDLDSFTKRMNEPLIELIMQDFIYNPVTSEDIIIMGLLLGHPLESSCSTIMY